MSKFNKPLKSIVVTTLGGNTFNAADTADAPIASDALRDFEAYGIMHIKGQSNETLIPFHAVDRVVVAKTMEDRADKNPYGCTAQGGGSEGKVCSAQVCKDSVGE